MLVARRILALLGVGVLPAWLWAQAPPSPAASASAPANPFLLSPEERAGLDQLAREDHADMMRQPLPSLPQEGEGGQSRKKLVDAPLAFR